MKQRKKNLNLNVETKLFAILGYPIKHSFSPLMQNAWFEQEKLNCAYMSFETDPKNLKKTLEALKILGFCGINITIPHKTAVMEFLDYTDKASKRIGSVNTIAIKNGKLYGYNTDYSGFVSDLISKNIKIKGKTIFIFGAGGAARAIIYSVKSSGAKMIYLANRTHKTALSLAGEFEIEAPRKDKIIEKAAQSDLIINASSCGMNKTDRFPFEIKSLKKNAVIYEIIYNKLTPFIKAAKKNKIAFYTGEGMLINQGAHGFKIWTGIYPDTKSALKLLNKFMR
ncbi:MAG: shikimate dehydrogenase [Endomicrobium sp.]|jgi:shikimate dehydrogenase|nr:shikimate dehydrogenase [Endomicrobium sp.]